MASETRIYGATDTDTVLRIIDPDDGTVSAETTITGKRQLKPHAISGDVLCAPLFGGATNGYYGYSLPGLTEDWYTAAAAEAVGVDSDADFLCAGFSPLVRALDPATGATVSGKDISEPAEVTNWEWFFAFDNSTNLVLAGRENGTIGVPGRGMGALVLASGAYSDLEFLSGDQLFNYAARLNGNLIAMGHVSDPMIRCYDPALSGRTWQWGSGSEPSGFSADSDGTYLVIGGYSALHSGLFLR